MKAEKLFYYFLILIVTISLFSLLACGSATEEETTQTETESETVEETTYASPLEILKFTGEYRDTSDSSTMYMTAYGDYLKIKIIFSNEAKTYFNLWEMTGTLDFDTEVISYFDAIKTTYSQKDDGTYSKTIIYTGGTGSIKSTTINDVRMCVWSGNMSGDKSYNIKYVYAFASASSQLQEYLTIIENN